MSVFLSFSFFFSFPFMFPLLGNCMLLFIYVHHVLYGFMYRRILGQLMRVETYTCLFVCFSSGGA